MIWQRALFDQFPNMKILSSFLDCAISNDSFNQSMVAKFPHLDFDMEEKAAGGDAPELRSNRVNQFCALRDEFISRSTNRASIATEFMNPENEAMKVCALLYRRMFLTWCGRNQ